MLIDPGLTIKILPGEKGPSIEMTWKDMREFFSARALSLPWDDVSQADYKTRRLREFGVLTGEARRKGGIPDQLLYSLWREAEDAHAKSLTRETVLSDDAIGEMISMIRGAGVRNYDTLDELRTAIHRPAVVRHDPQLTAKARPI